VATVGAVPGTEVTPREAEVFALIARHLTNAQIADALVISERTVESHVSAMLRKLQLPDRRSLARHAATVSSLSADPGRRALPVPVTPFVGRTAERAALAAALAGHRMVTATGPDVPVALSPSEITEYKRAVGAANMPGMRIAASVARGVGGGHPVQPRCAAASGRACAQRCTRACAARCVRCRVHCARVLQRG
jgi:DNA-binding CsgD family transcriptional regulator